MKQRPLLEPRGPNRLPDRLACDEDDVWIVAPSADDRAMPRLIRSRAPAGPEPADISEWSRNGGGAGSWTP